MKKSVLCLSGWAQKSNSLEVLFKNNDGFEVSNFDYSAFDNVEDFFSEIKGLNQSFDILVGWSLGGQLSCRIIADNILSPEKLILIGTPFQFVKDKRIAAAMPQNSFYEFRDNFNRNPDFTMKKFSLLMNINDKNAKELADNLDINNENHQKLAFWLDELERFSCYDIKFDNFPKTIIFHGAADRVVHESQAKIFSSKIENTALEIIAGCGHTPHINFTDFMNERIKTFLSFKDF